jgi:hypothetical protein
MAKAVLAAGVAVSLAATAIQRRKKGNNPPRPTL